MPRLTKKKLRFLQDIVNLFGEDFFDAGNGRKIAAIPCTDPGRKIYTTPLPTFLTEEQITEIEQLATDALQRTNVCREKEGRCDYIMRSPVRDWRVDVSAEVWETEESVYKVCTMVHVKGLCPSCLLNNSRTYFFKDILFAPDEHKAKIITALDSLYTVLRNRTDITGHDSSLSEMNGFVDYFAQLNLPF